MAGNKLYRTDDIVSVGAHYAGAGLILGAAIAGSFALGMPWLGLAAAAYVGAVNSFRFSKVGKFMQDSLTPHDESHPHSPNLGKIANELYAKTGLSAKSHPLYDFEPVDTWDPEAKKGFNGAFREMFGRMAQTHNAAAMKLGKPVIMISTPLLKLLDDEEEKAVLAHEFVHAKAEHTRNKIPHGLMGGVAATTAGFASFITMLGAGVVGIAAAIGGALAVAVGVSAVAAKIFGDPKTVKKLQTGIAFSASAVGIGILTAFNPIYLPVAVAAAAVKIGVKAVGANYSKDAEFQADRGAVTLGANPLSLITALRKISTVHENSVKEAMDGKLPQKGALAKAWKMMTATHPKLEARIERLSDIARKNGYSQAEIDKAAKAPIHISNDHNIPPDVIRTLMHYRA